MTNVNKQNDTDRTNNRTGMKQFMSHDSRDVTRFNVRTQLMTTRVHSAATETTQGENALLYTSGFLAAYDVGRRNTQNNVELRNSFV